MDEHGRITTRYGIGELYGKNLARLSGARIRELAGSPVKSRECPFREAPCNKPSGVCTMRLYRKRGELGIPCSDGLVTMCPSRFLEGGEVFSWVGKELLDAEAPVILRELPFLVSTDGKKKKAVGKIDMVLVDSHTDLLSWCALEMQAVYFSGKAMSSDFRQMKNWRKDGIPFPSQQRRPDFRSSGPKRLMPQLQTKVPTISRWGKKTAVVVDLPFWDSLGAMTEVESVSDCDIAWFVVDYAKNGKTKEFGLTKHSLHLTTLNRAVEGLTGGVPTSQPAFEAELRKRLKATLQ